MKDNFLKSILDAGGNVYEVGGCVRDQLLGHPSKDKDYLVTKLPIEKLTSLLKPLGKVALVGKSFGVIKFTPHSEPDVVYDIALPRTEKSTGTAHREFEVTFDENLPVEVDLARRDFTINAIAKDLSTGKLVDPFHGQDDLNKKQLKQVFLQAFPEDPLRILRGIQFAARLGFTIEPETAASMQQHAELLKTVSGERIMEEMVKLFKAPKPSVGFILMRDLGILPIAIPELAANVGVEQDKQAGDDVFAHTMRVVDAARGDQKVRNAGDLTLMLAALFHDVGKARTKQFDPKVGRITFYGHQLVSKRQARKRLAEWHCQTVGIDPARVLNLIEHHMFETKSFFSDKAIRRFIHKVGQDEILLLMDFRLADNRGGKHPNSIGGVEKLRARVQAELDRKPPFGPKDLAIRGDDLMGIGVKPSPLMGYIIQQCVDLVLDEPEKNTKEELLALAVQIRDNPPDASLLQKKHHGQDSEEGSSEAKA
ncbi:MAG: hypothetical protein COV45_07380 [Deltaproteobacteria bacterium CG11_big_fil_rev_8_21_14_0_20_47_16]|nr:MAG: hypothetical protein COV45_07380 [Deltaproteobacteria bacterium CG11_big_fil_rev_8_21_14_0_20_47_16]